MEEYEPSKILLVYSNCAIGGIETLHLRLCKALRQVGKDARLFFFRKGPFAEYIPTDVPVLYGDLALLLQHIVEENYDLVHGVAWDLRQGLDIVHKLTSAPRLIVTAHGGVCPGWTSKNIDGIVACAEWLKNRYERVTDLHVSVVLNAIDLENYPMYSGPFRGPPIIGWVGRANDLKQKRIDRLGSIASLLTTAGLRIEIVSPGLATELPCKDTRDALVAHTSRWETRSPSAMPEFYRRVAESGGLILMTSDWEGLPAVPCEAQASGCVVASTNVPGSNESVRAEHGGVLFDRDIDPHRLAQLLIDLVRDERGQKRRALDAVTFVRQRFSASRLANDYLDIYRQSHVAKKPQLPLRMYASAYRHRPQKMAFKFEATQRHKAAQAMVFLGERRAHRHARRTATLAKLAALLTPGSSAN